MKTFKEIEQYFEGTSYKISDNRCLLRMVVNAKGESVFPISNFIAYIVGEEIFDNGAEVKRYFVIDGMYCGGTPLPRIKVLATEFNSCAWVSNYWGAKCNIEPYSNNKEYLRHSIQLTARSITAKTIFGHLGFRKMDNKWVYIHGNGAIGMDNLSVELTPRLSSYGLTNNSFPINDYFRPLRKIVAKNNKI